MVITFGKKMGQLHPINKKEGTVIASGETYNELENKKKKFDILLNEKDLSLSICYKHRAYTIDIKDIIDYASQRFGLFADRVKIEGEIIDEEER